MTKSEITFESGTELLENVLRGTTRRAIIDDLSTLTDYREALLRLRTAMRTNTFKFGTSTLNLERTVKGLDNRTRQDGFHALHDWDGKADKLNEDVIPVDLVNYFSTATSRPPYPAVGFAIFLDYYFLYLLGMLCLRAWDSENAGASLDHLTDLLNFLQGPGGSGQKFVDNAETLILVATSHFEPDSEAYSRLLTKVRSLPAANRLRIALAHGAILGSHLRFGFEPFYKRDLALMRADNVPDYPWLFFSLITMLRAYDAGHDSGQQDDERCRTVEGILNALTPDTRAFLGKAPPALARNADEVMEFQSLFLKYRGDLVAEFEEHRPTNQNYSPIAFNFNFPHNIIKAIVVNAVARGESTAVSFNDLLSGFPRDPAATRSKYAVMTRLIEYARMSPEIIRGRSFPMVVYDPLIAIRNYTKALGLIKELTGTLSDLN